MILDLIWAGQFRTMHWREGLPHGSKRTLSCSNSCQQQFPDQHQKDVMLPLAQGRTSAAPSHDSGGASVP